MNLGKFDCSSGVINILYNDNIRNISVRTSTIKDLLLIDKLQKDNSYAVGFIQKTVWEKYVFGGERNFVVFICMANNDAVGYVLITPGKGSYKLFLTSRFIRIYPAYWVCLLLSLLISLCGLLFFDKQFYL
jgi:hypothetical protein